MEKTCEACDAPFAAKRSTALYCSKACRQRAHRDNLIGNATHWRIRAAELRAEVEELRQETQKSFDQRLQEEIKRRYQAAVAKYPQMPEPAKGRLWLYLISTVAPEIGVLLGSIETQAFAFYLQHRVTRPAGPPAEVVRAFRLFGLAHTATLDEAKKAYRAAAIRHHPDHNPNGPNRMPEVNAAWETLKSWLE